MARKIQHVSVRFSEGGTAYAYKAEIGGKGPLTEPLEAGDVVVCQVGFTGSEGKIEVSHTIGVVVNVADDSGRATRYIVQKVDLDESDRLTEAEENAKQIREQRKELLSKLEKRAMQNAREVNIRSVGTPDEIKLLDSLNEELNEELGEEV